MKWIVKKDQVFIDFDIYQKPKHIYKAGDIIDDGIVKIKGKEDKLEPLVINKKVDKPKKDKMIKTTKNK